MREEWKDISGYEGLYQVSNLGNVKSLVREWNQKHYSGGSSHYKTKERILKQRKDKNTGYMYIGITKDRKQKKYAVHRLVAMAFLNKKDNENYINHLDNNKTNNRVDNLEWCTQSHNIKYAYDNKTKKPPHMKKVQQLDFDGNVINIFESLQEAFRKTGIQATNINKCCEGKRNQAGGYKWQHI
jgi:mevalonate kinase